MDPMPVDSLLKGVTTPIPRGRPKETELLFAGEREVVSKSSSSAQMGLDSRSSLLIPGTMKNPLGALMDATSPSVPHGQGGRRSLS